MQAERAYRLVEIAEHIGARPDSLRLADPALQILGLASLAQAESAHISFVTDGRHLEAARASRAGVLICTPELAEQLDRACLVVAEPYLAYARLSRLFALELPPTGIDSSARIHPSARIGEGVSIGPNVVIGEATRIGNQCAVGAGTVIGRHCQLGERSRLHANVTLYDHVSLGVDCLVHSGAVIGADGFGFAPSSEGWIKIHQLGGVRIGNQVEIGANSCIDRGALDPTVIEDGVKIDDLVMIAHNVRIGRHSALAGQVGIAGSTEVGANCTLAGNVGLVGHIRLADNVHVTGKSMITSSISEPGSYSAGTPYSETRKWRKNAARFNQLDRLFQRLQKLEKNQ